MEDILNDIISLSEKKRGEKKLGNQQGDHQDIHQDDNQTKISAGRRHEGKNNQGRRKQKLESDLPGGAVPASTEDAPPSSTWDSSTVCSVDEDMSVEKANLFSRIINERRKIKGDRRASLEKTNFGDIEQGIHQVTLQGTQRCVDAPHDYSIDEHTPLCQHPNTFNSYLLTVNQINTQISSIYKNIDKINSWKEKIDFNIYDTEELNAKINSTIKNTEHIISQVMTSIFSLNEENKQFEASTHVVSEIKLRTNIFIDVVQKYKACINKYKNICHHYYEHVNANLLKQYRLICPNVIDAEDGGRKRKTNSTTSQGKVCKGGREKSRTDLDDIEHFFNLQKKNNYGNLGEHVHAHPENADGVNIQKMKKKYKELKALEKNISALNDLYIELAYVVKKRTNYINSIENNVYQVKDYTDDAIHNIVAAKRYNALVKRKIFYFSLFLLVIALIILFPIFFNYSTYSLR
ncbi:syntaxin, putative [Plasmodium knowlesi strain H]|uniref:Syntaxin, putative n=3 Tax=Plasmodium knowlesi TaxID=5850 RepID=A0A5K1USE3_PLAKH|nr:syntaxin, putative [Plasmodium knowlesi strain H]OTN67828.1 putative Syntaxin [Plasmodium knowlesi]CAA9990304.1 syntaxin, putative [Plasmodium knowlesi strain H]SBO19510.1 syntaxin, putative [Plasmodium knowlesi strain H]SBO22816.1 syntaxin, putative [Plasmodium knowlesi strain H]VVS79778.1 syntaxin, putative [Plasmodium knowlesi strain H]|eukprot:XP_002260704.1 syntaxin, putative [Plasmodium knowlesi strain H]